MKIYDWFLAHQQTSTHSGASAALQNLAHAACASRLCAWRSNFGTSLRGVDSSRSPVSQGFSKPQMSGRSGVSGRFLRRCDGSGPVPSRTEMSTPEEKKSNRAFFLSFVANEGKGSEWLEGEIDSAWELRGLCTAQFF